MPIGIGTALVATAAIGTAAAVGSSIIGANAAGEAADKQAAAARQGMDAATRTRLEMFEKAKGYLDPYATLGTEALPTIKSLLGIGGDPNEMTSTLEKYPGYQFAVDQGQKAISNQQIGLGAKYSGNALKAAADYSRNMGYNVFSDYYGKLSGIAGMGQNAATGIANAATGVGSENALTYQQGYGDIGNAEAAGIMGKANAWASGITGVADAVSGGINAWAKPVGFKTGGTGGWSGGGISTGKA